MKKILISAVLALTLVALLAVPAVATEKPITASVTVEGLASVTVEDNGAPGLNWFNQYAATDDEPEADAPSILVYTAPENNLDIYVYIKGTDFSDGGSNSFGIENAHWDVDDTIVDYNAMSTTYDEVAVLGADENVSIFHWLSIPSGQAAATYESTFTYYTGTTTP